MTARTLRPGEEQLRWWKQRCAGNAVWCGGLGDDRAGRRCIIQYDRKHRRSCAMTGKAAASAVSLALLIVDRVRQRDGCLRVGNHVRHDADFRCYAHRIEAARERLERRAAQAPDCCEGSPGNEHAGEPGASAEWDHVATYTTQGASAHGTLQIHGYGHTGSGNEWDYGGRRVAVPLPIASSHQIRRARKPCVTPPGT